MLRIRASVICVDEDKLLVVRLQDPVSRKIYRLPPGGGIESGESAAEAAEREAREETGYQVQVDPQSETVLDYLFLWGDLKVDCQTHFFQARLLPHPPSPPISEPYHLGPEWLPLNELERELDYHPTLRTKILSLVTKR